jgi:hypothetical protein
MLLWVDLTGWTAGTVFLAFCLFLVFRILYPRG